MQYIMILLMALLGWFGLFGDGANLAWTFDPSSGGGDVSWSADPIED